MMKKVEEIMASDKNYTLSEFNKTTLPSLLIKIIGPVPYIYMSENPLLHTEFYKEIDDNATHPHYNFHHLIDIREFDVKCVDTACSVCSYQKKTHL